MIRIADIRGVVANARARKATKATPVTPYVRIHLLWGPTLSPCVVTGAVGNDNRGSWVIFRQVENDLHKVRADIGNLREDTTGDSGAEAPRGLTDSKTYKLDRLDLWKEHKDTDHEESSTLIRRSPTLIPEVRMLTTSTLPSKGREKVSEFAHVLMRMPNHATP